MYGKAEVIVSRDLVDAKDDAWFQARREGITATDVGALTGNSAFGKTAFTVYWTKVADLRTPSNKQMDIGTDWQDDVLKRAYLKGSKLYPWEKVVTPGLLRNIARPWMLSSVDALVYDGALGWAPLEIKTSAKYGGWGTEGTDEIPRDYWCQVAWQAMTVGANHGYCAVMLPSHDIQIYKVERNPDWDWLVSEADRFRNDHLLPENPPAIEGTSAELTVMKKVQQLNSEDVVEANAEMLALVAELKHLRATKKSYADLIDVCELRIREKMGAAKAVVNSAGAPMLVRNVVKRNGFTVEPTEFETIRLPKVQESESEL